MTPQPTGKASLYALVAALGLVLALAIGRPEPAALSAPLLVSLLVGLALAEEPGLVVEASVDRDRLLEGETLTLVVQLAARRQVSWLQVAPVLPEGVAPLVSPATRGLGLEPGQRREVRIQLRCERWGVHRLGRLAVRAHDPLGFVLHEAVGGPTLEVRVHPATESLRRALAPVQTQARAGDRRSRLAGDGLEFANVRIYEPGDPLRWVNWRLSSRSERLHVNQFHPDQNADVVLFLDSFVDLHLDRQSTLQLAVRAALSIARHHLGHRDRLGLISFGGTLRWLPPGVGLAHAQAVAEALLDTEASLSYAWKGVEVIPSRVLPAKALVLALSPLIDERALAALVDLRRRGFDVAILEVPAEAFVTERDDAVGRIAWRLWRLRREALRFRLRQLGVGVAPWFPAGPPLAAVLEELQAFRLRVRLRSA